MKALIRPDEEIVSAYMAWARRLIAQVRFEQHCEETLEFLIGISELLTRIEEMGVKMEGGASPAFLQAHRDCLESIQASTRRLIQNTEGGIDGDELLTKARTFAAFLDDSHIRWHSTAAPESVEALSLRIFHGAA